MQLILQGYKGKMGSVIKNYLMEQGYEFVQLIDKDDLIDENKVIQADAFIDFSTTESAMQLFHYAIKYHKPIIIGTTGFSKKQKEEIRNQTIKNKTCTFLIANFLKSIHEIKKLVDEMEKSSEKIYISEMHHKSKLDSPSGTARFIMQDVDKNKVEVSARRTDFYCYEHRIDLIGEFETIEIIHKCYNKLAYVKGVEQVLQICQNRIGFFENL